jgi:hypothetical protein
MASIKELHAAFLIYQAEEMKAAAAAAAARAANIDQEATELADLLIDAVAVGDRFVKFPGDMFSAIFKTSLGIFEFKGLKVSKDRINNNLSSLTTLLEALDPRMDAAVQAAAIAKLVASEAKKEVGVPRFQERPRKDKKKAAKKERQAWDENSVAAAMARARAKAEAEAKANPAGLPAGAEDLTATV